MITINVFPSVGQSSFQTEGTIENVALRQEVESMMGGYGIYRNNGIYSGYTDSALEWLSCILNMYNLSIK